MTAIQRNLRIEQGATFELKMHWKVDDVAVDLTGYSARMQGRSRSDSPSALFDLSDGSGIALGGAEYNIIITLSAAATLAMKPQTGVYDLLLISPSGAVTRFIEGEFTVVAGVTIND